MERSDDGPFVSLVLVELSGPLDGARKISIHQTMHQLVCHGSPFAEGNGHFLGRPASFMDVFQNICSILSGGNLQLSRRQNLRRAKDGKDIAAS